MSTKFKKTIEYFAKLQGIGPRQAFRLALALLSWPKDEINNFAQAISGLASGVNFCQNCFNFSEADRCHICLDARRDPTKICVVEKVTDLESIEKTGLYRGLYHVLGGAINPIDGFLPKNLKIEELVERIRAFQTQSLNGHASELEIILATNPNTYGETTALYLEELIKATGVHPVKSDEVGAVEQQFNRVKITRLAKGLSSGSYLEYVDSITLQNAFKNRK